MRNCMNTGDEWLEKKRIMRNRWQKKIRYSIKMAACHCQHTADSCFIEFSTKVMIWFFPPLFVYTVSSQNSHKKWSKPKNKETETLRKIYRNPHIVQIINLDLASFSLTKIHFHDLLLQRFLRTIGNAELFMIPRRMCRCSL